MLDALGEEGWELAGSTEFVDSRKPVLHNAPFSYTAAYQLIFKRPKP